MTRWHRHTQLTRTKQSDRPRQDKTEEPGSWFRLQQAHAEEFRAESQEKEKEEEEKNVGQRPTVVRVPMSVSQIVKYVDYYAR